ncbi:MAG: DUF2061 domain-containing protein [Flavobacteriaceae bacterium]
MNKEESHLRSILKGISWRVIATTDTILIVLLVTCSFGNCSIGSAIEIGLIEFIVKLGIYYLHERIWQKILKTKSVSKRWSLFKTISWRVVATSTTFIISDAVLDNFEGAIYIAALELITKFALYYFHERLWLKMSLGRIRNYFKKN